MAPWAARTRADARPRSPRRTRSSDCRPRGARHDGGAPRASVATLPPPESALITHVVLMKLTDRAEAPEAKRRLEALPPLVPELRTLRVELDTLGLDGSSDLVLVTTHDSAEGLAAYAQHPAHQEFLAWLRPRLAGRAAVDYES